MLVAPAGDDGASTDAVNFPAAYRGVISAGAFNSAFTKAPFSSHRPYVTLTAAGDGVIAANGTQGYALVSSTAAASAVVAGIVALIRTQFPALSPAQVTSALTQSTVFRRPGGQQDGSGAGTVDAAAALDGGGAHDRGRAHLVGRDTSGARSARSARFQRRQQDPAPRHRHQRGPVPAAGGADPRLRLLPAPADPGRPARRSARGRPARGPQAAGPCRGSDIQAGRLQLHRGAARGGIPAAASPPANGIRPASQPQWAPWGSESGPPEGAFPDSAFPRPGQRNAPLFPAAPGGLGGPPEPADPDEPSWPAVASGRLWQAGPGPAGPARAGPPLSADTPDADAAGEQRVAPPPRTPSISGRPPWEPAPEPAGEVPWSQSPMPQTGGARMFPTGQPSAPTAPTPAFPAGEPPEAELSPWDAIAEEAWPGGPSASGQPAQRGPDPANHAPGQASDSGGGRPGEDPADGSRPIYVWNPSASTETIQAVPPGENHKR